jgi:geranylgeranyl diphosphate synthase type I
MGDLALAMVNGPVVNDPLLDDATKVRVIRELIDMTCRTVEGQALDLGWARDKRYDLTTEDYLTMAIHKTAHYSGAVPLAVGAITGGGTEEEIEALRSFGLDTGLAFQIQDDLLNLIGTEESTKKDFRNDLTEGKRTLMVVHALNHATPEVRDRLVEILSSHTRDQEELAEAVALLEQTGSIDYARTFAEELTQKAKAQLVLKIPTSPYRDLLVSMADWFVNRLK